MLTVNMLGKCAIFYDNECISDKLSSKLVALICLLVLNRNRNMSKEKIIAYLWPDSDEEAAKSNLRFNLWNIKKTIPQSAEGEDFIISGKDFCRINEKYVFQCDKTQLDCCKVSQIERIEDLLKLKDLFQGDFLEGLYLRNCNEFNEMILFERVVCQNKQVEILEKLIGLYEEQGRYEEELEILNEVTAIEPYNEQFACQAIQTYGKLGNRTAAINYYKNFEIILRRNLNISPNNDLKLLYKDMLESASGTVKQEPCSGENQPKRQIDVKLYGLRDVEYFGLAIIIDQIICDADMKYILELDQAFLCDLGYLHAGIAAGTQEKTACYKECAGTVPPARLAVAFLKLMDHISRRYDIRIQIDDMEELDPFTRDLVRHFEKRKPNHINFLY